METPQACIDQACIDQACIGRACIGRALCVEVPAHRATYDPGSDEARIPGHA